MAEHNRMSWPQFITFTGADAHTDIDRMASLSCRYPIEWGILFSPKRQGSGRYPPMSFIERVVERDGLHLSAHLCGAHSVSVLERWITPISLRGFGRAQINTAAPWVDLEAAERWARREHVRAILQCRSDFPRSTKVAWLFDQSGGRGLAPTRAWPEQHPASQCGYAGGIGPGNVVEVLSQIDATDFWIDMESGVRNEADRFDLDLCERVCELVFGRPAGRGTPA